MAVNTEAFEAKVDRSGEHHLWTGAVDQSGTGQFKVDGSVRSPASIARELAHGAVPDGTARQGCPDERLCIHPDHLQLRRYGGKKSNAGIPLSPTPRTGSSTTQRSSTSKATATGSKIATSAEEDPPPTTQSDHQTRNRGSISADARGSEFNRR